MSEFDLPVKEIQKRLTVDQRMARVGAPEGLTPRQTNAITMARLQHALSDLADGKVAQVSAWLDEVGTRNPAEAIRLFMELLEFRMPRLKAAQVTATLPLDQMSSRNLASMSIEVLNRIVAEG